MSTITANVAHVNNQTGGVYESGANNRSRGHMTMSKGHGISQFTLGMIPTFKLRGKYGHVVVNCW